MSQPVETTQFILPAKLENNLEQQEAQRQRLVIPDANYEGGLELVSAVLPDFVDSQFNNTQMEHKEVKRLKSPSSDTPSRFSARLAIGGYRALRIDHEHQTLSRMAELVMGSASAHGDEATAKRAEDLGERIIQQRIKHAAISAIIAGRLPRQVVRAFDGEDGEYLQIRAKEAWDAKPNNPMQGSSPKDAKRFDSLVAQSHAGEIKRGGWEDDMAEAGGIFKRVGATLAITKKKEAIRKEAGNPETASKALEDTFDTLLPTAEIEVSPRQAQAIFGVLAKLDLWLAGAASMDPQIAQDPRPGFAHYIATHITDYDLKKSMAEFREGAKRAAEAEPR